MRTKLNLLNNKHTLMKTISKFGFVLLAVGTFWNVSLSGSAQTPDIFTKHELPISGAYFTHRESHNPPTAAVNKSGQGVREKKQTTPDPTKRLTLSVHFHKQVLSC